MGFPGGEPVSDDDSPVYRRDFTNTRRFDQFDDLVGKGGRVDSGEEVIQGDEAVSFSSTEVCLTVDYRLSASASNLLERHREEFTKTNSEVGAFKEETRIEIFG